MASHQFPQPPLMLLPADAECPPAGMVGDHPAMRRLYGLIHRAAPLETPVIVYGPTGVGKEHVAEALHSLSGRRGRFVAVNVASLPESIADSELFGVVRGAYTGAVADRPGLVAAAAGGTLFLDEAADLPLAVQAKLLRVLDGAPVRPVGGPSGRPTQFRLVLSTQQPANELMAAGRWRADFYYRVAGLTLRVPSLGERPSDIPLLVNHFLRRAGAAPFRAADATLIASHAWPGNVRQLMRAVERAVFRAQGMQVSATAVLDAALEDDHHAAAPAAIHTGNDLPGSLREATRQHIARVLASTHGDARAAAAALGLSRSQFYRRRQALGMRRTFDV